MQLMDMFPDEASAERWFIETRWPEGRTCPHCGSDHTTELKSRKPMPYFCNGCRSYFSVRTGTPLQNSRLPLRKWVFAVYLYVTNLKSVSSMKLHRDIGVTQKTAWFMMHRLREAWDQSGLESLIGPVETDETYMGGKRKNMSQSKRKAAKEAGLGRGTAGKTVVAGMKDRESGQVRARVVPGTDKPTLQGFVQDNAEPGATLYTDEHGAYPGMGEFVHEAVNHSVGEYVRQQAHTNGIESFWALLKRGYTGTFHKLSPKHLQRYVDEFAGRSGCREADTVVMMGEAVTRM
ncbi:MAG: IS1595 family transposase, partial [Alphaproteobacteria bacterium]|nr:IS1595 family transposase [Alphaproteobacteria bacterium]